MDQILYPFDMGEEFFELIKDDNYHEYVLHYLADQNEVMVFVGLALYTEDESKEIILDKIIINHPNKDICKEIVRICDRKMPIRELIIMKQFDKLKYMFDGYIINYINQILPLSMYRDDDITNFIISSNIFSLYKEEWINIFKYSSMNIVKQYININILDDCINNYIIKLNRIDIWEWIFTIINKEKYNYWIRPWTLIYLLQSNTTAEIRAYFLSKLNPTINEYNGYLDLMVISGINLDDIASLACLMEYKITSLLITDVLTKIIIRDLRYTIRNNILLRKFNKLTVIKLLKEIIITYKSLYILDDIKISNILTNYEIKMILITI